MNRVLVVVGTRPEAIKMSPVIEALASHQDVETTVLATGQHRELLQQALSMFDVVPHFDLQVMTEGQRLSDVTAKVLCGTTEILSVTMPSLVLVHGDTTTSMAAALASFYQGIPVGHVEAGLRTYNPRAPFPEELNRQITGRLATLHFAPTHLAQAHLLNEGVEQSRVWITGNTIVDALIETLKRVEDDPVLKGRVSQRLDQALPFEWRSQPFILVTAHRRENFNSGIDELCRALSELATRNTDVHVVYPVHPNPVVRSLVHERLDGLRNIHVPSPLGYQDFSVLLRHCRFVITDSGGIQEEAPILGKPVLVIRDVTERPEGVDSGAAALIGAHFDAIVDASQDLIEDTITFQRMAVPRSVFGDGRAGRRIADIVIDFVASGLKAQRT